MEQQIEHSPQRIFALDALRVVAVYLTFVSHTYLFDRDVFSLGKWSFPFAAPAWACMWVLFTLSGYLAGWGFASGKYELNRKGIGAYYYGKLTKIWLPALVFIFVISALSYPDYLPGNTPVLWKFLFLTFRSDPAHSDIWHTWFVFDVMGLYLLTPMFCLVAKKMPRKAIPPLCGAVLALGLLFRLHMRDLGKDYVTEIYLPLYAQFDFFISGLLLSFYKESPEKSNKNSTGGGYKKRISVCLLMLTYLFGFLAVWEAEAHGKPALYNTVYSYYGPTMFAIATLLFISSFEGKEGVCPRWLKKPVEMLAKYGFEFYLLHTSALIRLTPYIKGQNLFLRHVKILVYVFLVSLVLSIGYQVLSLEMKRRIDRALSDRLQINHAWEKCLFVYAAVAIIFVLVFMELN